MTVTAQTWIEAAYNRSSANDPGKLAQDPELLDHLNRLYLRLYTLFARARPDEAATSATISLAGTPPTASLPTEVIDILRIENTSGKQVHLIPVQEKQRLWHLAPSVMRLGTLLQSRAMPGDPLAGDALTLYLLDTPTALTALNVSVDARFPTRHHQLPIDALAVYLSVKDDGRNAEAHQKLVGDMAQAAQAFAAEYNLPPSAMEWVHGDAQRSSAGAG